MKIDFKYLTIDELVEILSWSLTQTGGILPLSEVTCELYPELRTNVDDTNKVKELINNSYIKTYKEMENNKVKEKFVAQWQEYNDTFFNELAQYFNVKIDKNITCKIGLLPVCPRNINYLEFDLNIYNNVIETSMHECCHFYFFERCKSLIPNLDCEKDFDYPSLLWYLSEIVIDPILNKERFRKIYNYEFRSYDNFYDIEINGENLIEKMRKIYDENNFENALKISLDYLKSVEKEFRIKCGESKQEVKK